MLNANLRSGRQPCPLMEAPYLAAVRMARYGAGMRCHEDTWWCLFQIDGETTTCQEWGISWCIVFLTWFYQDPRGKTSFTPRCFVHLRSFQRGSIATWDTSCSWQVTCIPPGWSGVLDAWIIVILSPQSHIFSCWPCFPCSQRLHFIVLLMGTFNSLLSIVLLQHYGETRHGNSSVRKETSFFHVER